MSFWICLWEMWTFLEYTFLPCRKGQKINSSIAISALESIHDLIEFYLFRYLTLCIKSGTAPKPDNFPLNQPESIIAIRYRQSLFTRFFFIIVSQAMFNSMRFMCRWIYLPRVSATKFMSDCLHMHICVVYRRVAKWLECSLSDSETLFRISPWLICQEGEFFMISVWRGDPSIRHVWQVPEKQATDWDTPCV